MTALTVEQVRRRCAGALRVAIAEAEDIGWCDDCASSATVCATHAQQLQAADEWRETLAALTPQTAAEMAVAS